MRKLLSFITIIFITQLSFGQSMKFSGTISEIVDVLSKKNKIKKNQFESETLGDISITVYTKNKSIKSIKTSSVGKYTISFKIAPNTSYFIKYSKKGYYHKISQIDIGDISTDEYFDLDEWNIGLRKIKYSVSDDILNKPFERWIYNNKKRILVEDLDYRYDYDYAFEEEFIAKIEVKTQEKIEQEILDNENARAIIEKANQEAKSIIENAKSNSSAILAKSKLRANNILDNIKTKANKQFDTYVMLKKSEYDADYQLKIDEWFEIEKLKLIHRLEDSIRNSEIVESKNNDHNIFSKNDHFNQKKADLNAAKQRLKNEKLKAQTFEDKVKLRMLEEQIFNAEQEIKLAAAQLDRNKEVLKLRDEIEERQQYIIISGIVFIILISMALVYIYKNLREKRKSAIILSKKNEIIEEKNQSILSSIKYAKRIQEAILPHNNFWNETLPESFVLYMPKDIVSGDYYWLEKIKDNILFAAVDCTGHGVPGAFMSIVGYNSLNRAINEFKLTKPGDILDSMQVSVNEVLQKGFGDKSVKDGMDVALCNLNYKKMELQYAGAYNPLWVIRNKEIIEVKATKQAVGTYMDNILSFENNVIKLEKGDLIYIFSDGFSDQFGGPFGKKIMQKGLKKLLIELNNLSPENQKKELKKYIYNWMNEGNENQVDDICLIGIKV